MTIIFKFKKIATAMIKKKAWDVVGANKTHINIEWQRHLFIYDNIYFYFSILTKQKKAQHFIRLTTTTTTKETTEINCFFTK